MYDNRKQTALHNRLVPHIVNSIVRPPREAGGEAADVLVLLQSVVVGVMQECVGPGDDGTAILDTLMENVEARLIEHQAEAKPDDTP